MRRERSVGRVDRWIDPVGGAAHWAFGHVAEGASEASVEGTTSNQSFDSWSLAGQTGQLLEISVSSAEGNVTFDVFSTDGEVLANDQTSSSIQLPADGLYAIEVGTGANSADYTLNVAVTS